MVMTALGYQTKLLHIVKKNLQTLTSLCKKLQQKQNHKKQGSDQGICKISV